MIPLQSIGELPRPANDEERRRLCLTLRDSLYAGVFSRGDMEDRRSRLSQFEVSDRQECLSSTLSAANQSRSFWSDGWRIERVEHGWIVASQRSRRRVARAHEYALTFTDHLRPRAGMAATLWFPRESLTLQQDVYYAFGEAIPDDEEEARAFRFYLHVRDGSLPYVFEIVTGELNRLEIPFTLKTMLAAHERDRRDATVLYIERKNADAVLRVLPKEHFVAGVPLFALEVAPGIGIAESPESGESFGMQRCRLVAEGVVDAWMRGRSDDEARLAAIERRFRAAGIDWERPHLNRKRITLSVANVVEWLNLDASQFRVTDCSRRNRNFAVARSDGSGYFVKQLRVRGLESLRMMEREAALIPLLGDLAPRLIRFDPDAEAIVLELLPNAEAPPVDLAVAAAKTLRRLPIIDSETFDHEPPAILTAHRGGPLTQWLGAGQLELIDQVRASDILAPALDHLAAEWRGEQLVHGDVKWDNCLWDPATSQLKWVDWELADAGDPLWDAGCFAQPYLHNADALRPALAAFLGEYGGDTTQIIRYAAARTIQTALEVMHGQPHPTPLALALLARSSELMAAPEEFATRELQ